MSIRFEGPGGNFRWRSYQLGALMDVARAYGWTSPGTRPPTDWPVGADWDGNYTDQQGQQVTAADALDLAAALESALPDIPDENAISPDKVLIWTSDPDVVHPHIRVVRSEVEEEDADVPLEELADAHTLISPSGDSVTVIPVRWVGDQIWGIVVGDEGDPLTSYELFSGENKAELIKFIAFCRQGGFVVR